MASAPATTVDEAKSEALAVADRPASEAAATRTGEAGGEAADRVLQLLQGDAGVEAAWMSGDQAGCTATAFAEVLAKWNKPGEFLSLTYSTDGYAGRCGYVPVVDRVRGG